jgi:cytochrome c oxidase subunit 2
MIALPTLRTFARRGLTALAVACLPLITGGWIYGPQSTFDTKGPVAKAQLDVFYVTLWVTGIIFVLVAGVLAYATLKFKARNDADEHAPVPAQGHGNPLIELGLIAASVIALVFIAIPTLHNIWYTYDVPAEEKANAYEVNAIGYQWWFKFEYPTEQVAADTPLVLANELVIPAGRAVRVNLRTFDVIHSFWVPKLAGKVDMMPNRANHLWLKADEPGYFWGQCAEYCGESHAVMRFRVIALNEADFAAWVEKQKQGAKAVTAPDAKPVFASYTPIKNERNLPGWSEEFDRDPFTAWRKQQQPDTAAEDVALIDKGRALFAAKTCNTCHAIRGDQQGGAPFAPDLTHVGSRTTIAGGLLENSPENLHRWLTDPNGVKPGNKMYRGFTGGMNGYVLVNHDTNTITGENIKISDDEARALVAYLHSLK